MLIFSKIYRTSVIKYQLKVSNHIIICLLFDNFLFFFDSVEHLNSTVNTAWKAILSFILTSRCQVRELLYPSLPQTHWFLMNCHSLKTYMNIPTHFLTALQRMSRNLPEMLSIM